MLLSASLLMYASPSHRNRPKADQKTSTSIDKLAAWTSRIIGTLSPFSLPSLRTLYSILFRNSQNLLHKVVLLFYFNFFSVFSLIFSLIFLSLL